MNSISTTTNNDMVDFSLSKQKSIAPTHSRYSSPSRKNALLPLSKAGDEAQPKKCPVRKISIIRTDNQEEGKLQSKTKNFRARSAKADDYCYRLQNLEVKHAMLKNELVMANREVALMVKKMRSYDEERWTLDIREKELKFKESNFATIERNWQNEIKKLEEKIMQLKNSKDSSIDRSVGLETKEEEEEEECNDSFNQQRDKTIKQNTIEILKNNLENSQKECHRIINEWERYKVRVKSMLAAKESEIKLLKENTNLTEDVKIILEENERLRKEREGLEQTLNFMRIEKDEMQVTLQELELRSCTAERLFSGLRDALKEERMAKNKMEKECLELNTQIKYLRQETDTTIAQLRSTLQEKEAPLKKQHEDESPLTNSIDAMKTVSSVTDDNTNDLDDSKIDHLTQTLIQTQNSIEMLLSDTLKLQYNKIESRGKMEIAETCSINCVDDHNRRRKRRSANVTDYILTNPVLSLSFFIYMLGLHILAINSYNSSLPEEELPQS